MENSYSYTFLKNDYFTPIEYKDDTVEAERKVEYREDPDSDSETYKTQTVNQLRPGVLRLTKAIESRSESELFVVLVTGLVNDIRDEFLLNYYTA